MKNDHPAVQPEPDGSKKPKANDAGRLPAAALTDRKMSMTFVTGAEMGQHQPRLDLNNGI